MYRHYKSVTLRQPTAQTQDAYGKLVNTTADTTINMAISTTNGNTQYNNNVLTVQSTHLGITKDNSITTSDIIIDGTTEYTVDFVIVGDRYTQVFLQLVV